MEMDHGFPLPCSNHRGYDSILLHYVQLLVVFRYIFLFLSTCYVFIYIYCSLIHISIYTLQISVATQAPEGNSGQVKSLSFSAGNDGCY